MIRIFGGAVRRDEITRLIQNEARAISKLCAPAHTRISLQCLDRVKLKTAQCFITIWSCVMGIWMHLLHKIAPMDRGSQGGNYEKS